MFCICCLEENSTYINLIKCIHGEYLNKFPIPNLSPPLELIVCCECHIMLKKIYQFNLQVKDSFNLLMKQALIEKNKNKKKTNFQVSQVEFLDIPEITETSNVATLKNNRIKNMATALDIIKTNTTSLQSLALFETLVKATSVNLNLENLNVLPHENKEHFASNNYLSDINGKNNSPALSVILEKPHEPWLDNNLKKENLTEFKESVTSTSNSIELIIKNEFVKLSETMKTMLPLNENNEEIGNDCNIAGLPDLQTEIKKEESIKEVINNNMYSTAVLPEIKTDSDMEILSFANVRSNVLPEVNKNTDTVNSCDILLPEFKKETELKITSIYCSGELPAQINKKPEVKLSANNVIENVLPIVNNNKDKSDCVLPDLPVQFKKKDIQINAVNYNLIIDGTRTEENKTDSEEEEFTDESSSLIEQEEVSNKTSTDATSKPALIAIKLNKKELLDEREDKLKSEEFLKWPHRCQHCVISFQYEINLEDHMKRKHEMKPNCVTCKICQQIVQKCDKVEHKFRHYNRIECALCKMRFILPDEANAHCIKVHNNGNTKRSKKRKALKSLRTHKKQKITENITKPKEQTDTSSGNDPADLKH